MDAQVQVEAKDGDPGEAADEDKVEEVAQKAAHVVPRQSAGDSESEKNQNENLIYDQDIV